MGLCILAKKRSFLYYRLPAGTVHAPYKNNTPSQVHPEKESKQERISKKWKKENVSSVAGTITKLPV